MKTMLRSLALTVALCVISGSAQTSANYQATVLSQNPTAYFKLDGSLESAINNSVVLESFAGGYVSDAYRNSSNAWAFNDQNTAYLRYFAPILNGGGVSNTTSTAKGSISFLFRALNGPNIGGQRALFDATTVNVGTTNHNAFHLFFENETSLVSPNSLKMRFGNSTTVLLEASNIIYGAWYYCAVTYDEARTNNKAIWYLGPSGGVLSSGMPTNSLESVAGDGSGIYIGQRADIKGAFRSPGKGRIDEFAIWGRELSATEISNQFTRLPQLPSGATYQQVVQSQVPKYYFKLDNSLTEAMGGTLMLSTNGNGGGFASDLLGISDWAFSFSKTNDALYITNDLFNGGGYALIDGATAAGVGSISLQFRMLSGTNNGQKFIFSAPGGEAVETDDNRLALFIEGPDSTNNPGSLKIMVGQQTQGNTSNTPTNTIPVAYATNLVPNAWYYFAMTYDESRNTPEVYYFFGEAGGPLKIGEVNPANNSVIGDNGWLAIGNQVISNIISGDSAFRVPGKGTVDEFAVWHEELTVVDIKAQFAAMVPPRPALNIAATGNNIVLSWARANTTGYTLESTPNLASPAWTNAGSPTVVGADYYVTNAISPGQTFFRLHKP
jgi:hypothetical protein